MQFDISAIAELLVFDSHFMCREIISIVIPVLTSVMCLLAFVVFVTLYATAAVLALPYFYDVGLVFGVFLSAGGE